MPISRHKMVRKPRKTSVKSTATGWKRPKNIEMGGIAVEFSSAAAI
ncbi:hypothetical protein [Pandoraea sp. CB10b_02]|nr:hypothetical protein [Pandoraea sp. CB10b_02]